MNILWSGRPEADQLLEEDPLALLIGLVLDQQVRMEKAFSGPYELKQRLGHLDAARIARMDPEALDAVFRERPALHRFPGNMARRGPQLLAGVVSDHGGGPPAGRPRSSIGQKPEGVHVGRAHGAEATVIEGGYLRFCQSLRDNHYSSVNESEGQVAVVPAQRSHPSVVTRFQVHDSQGA